MEEKQGIGYCSVKLAAMFRGIVFPWLSPQPRSGGKKCIPEILPLSLQYKGYRRNCGLRRLGRMGCETLAHFEPRLSLFSDDQEGEHDVFQKREGRLMNDQ